MIRAAKYANKADNIIDTTKVASNFAEFWNKSKTAVKNYCSFSEDTKVSTQEGEKEIADIQEGDYVLAWNEAIDEIGYYEVTDTFSHIDPVLTELIINGEWIETTPEHPFYTLENGWLPADELESGMHIRNADGDYELVWFKWNVEKDQEMYNFTVDTAHTYFVGEGQWLVHNECSPNPLEFWDRSINFDGIKVYQRDSFIDPNRITKIKGTNYSNLDLMKSGNAPFGPDGQRINLHHMLQTNDGPIVEVTQSFHQRFSKILHINPNSVPSGINRSSFDRWKQNYWKNRALDFK